MIPLYGFLEGDTIGLLVLADETDSAAVLVDKLQNSARVRVKARRNMNVVYKGQVIERTVSVAEARFEALDRFDVVEAKPR